MVYMLLLDYSTNGSLKGEKLLFPTRLREGLNHESDH